MLSATLHWVVQLSLCCESCVSVWGGGVSSSFFLSSVSSPPDPWLPHQSPVGVGWQQLHPVRQRQQRGVVSERE